MTDVPALCAASICLTLGERARRSSSTALLLLSVVVGLWGSTIRDQAVVAPVAVLLVRLGTARSRTHLLRLLVVAGGAGALFLHFEMWRRSLPNGMNPEIKISAGFGVQSAISAGLTVSLWLLPALALAVRPRGWSRPVAGASLFVGASLLILWTLRGFANQFQGNYFHPLGAYPEFVGHAVIPNSVVTIVNAAAILSAALLAGWFLEIGPQVPGTLGVYAILAAVGLLVPPFLGQASFDRYALPLLPPLLAFLLRATPHRAEPHHASTHARNRLRPSVPRDSTLRWILASSVLTVLFGLSITLTANALARDSARWKLATELVRAGIPAKYVDGGLAWNGAHSRTAASVHLNRTDIPTESSMRWFADSKRCFVISSRTMPGTSTVGTREFSTYAVFGHSEIHALRLGACPKLTLPDDSPLPRVLVPITEGSVGRS